MCSMSLSLTLMSFFFVHYQQTHSFLLLLWYDCVLLAPKLLLFAQRYLSETIVCICGYRCYLSYYSSQFYIFFFLFPRHPLRSLQIYSLYNFTPTLQPLMGNFKTYYNSCKFKLQKLDNHIRFLE